MALNTNPFVEGIDPTSTFGGYASVLLQLIRQAIPSSTYGMILFDTTPPDVTGSNAWRKTCLWISLANPAEPALYVYKTSSPGWVNINDIISPNSITTAMIQNNAVTLAKLSVSGGAANQLIRVNAGGTAFEFVSLSSLVTTGSILPAAISGVAVPPGTTRFLGNYNAGTTNWFTAQQVIEEVPDSIIANNQIAPAIGAATRSKQLTTRTADLYATWRFFEPNVDILNDTLSGGKLQNGTVDPVKIVSSGIPDGYVLGKVGGVPDWVAPTTVAGTIVQYVTAVGSLGAIPTVGSPTTLSHTLSAMPLMYRVVIYCETADGNYVNGDEIDALSCYIANGFTSDDQTTAFSILITSTNVVVRRQFNASIYVADKTTGAVHPITDARWRLRLYAMKAA